VRSTISKDEEPKKSESSPKRESPPGSPQAPPCSLPLIDMDTFQQILELDEEPDYEFTQQMVEAYFEQAAETFKKMDIAFKKKDLADLASLGHFLKGSSAALGLSRVQDTCESIQHSGQKRDEEKDRDLSPSEALTVIEGLLEKVRVEYDEAEAWLKKWCEDHSA
jgi:HPt (histidine-containing phosphotransfer) domain-containing protein